MKLSVIEPHGFCHGVAAAVRLAQTALESGGSVWCLHELVHNETVVTELRRLGMVFVSSPDEVPDGARVLFSAHGVAPSVRKAAEARGLKVVDATCPFVARAHRQVAAAAASGCRVIIIGHLGHVEVTGLAGEAPEGVDVVRTVADVAALPYGPDTRLAVVTQTTLSEDEVRETISALRARYPLLETSPAAEVCTATRDRQRAVTAFAADGGDGVLVLGSSNSSNTKRLAETAQKAGVRVWRAGSLAEAEKLDFSGVRRLGVTSGASTPECFLEAVVARLSPCS